MAVSHHSFAEYKKPVSVHCWHVTELSTLIHTEHSSSTHSQMYQHLIHNTSHIINIFLLITLKCKRDLLQQTPFTHICFRDYRE